MRGRRCIECDAPLKPEEQGALCSECYFAIITSPDLAEPVPRVEWQRASAADPRG